MLPNLFKEKPFSARLQSYLEEISSSSGIPLPEPDVKAYPDAVYLNYYALGISLLFVPVDERTPTTTTLDYEALSLDGIDIYNTVKDGVPSKGKTYSQFPLLPMGFSNPMVFIKPNSELDQFQLQVGTTGQDFVRSLGEPTRKGGGAGPSEGSISIWCEWSKHGIMVEFGGNEARGPQAWERGKDALWKIVTLFPPKDP